MLHTSMAMPKEMTITLGEELSGAEGALLELSIECIGLRNDVKKLKRKQRHCERYLRELERRIEEIELTV